MRKLCIDGSVALTGQVRFLSVTQGGARRRACPALGWYPLPFQGKEILSMGQKDFNFLWLCHPGLSIRLTIVISFPAGFRLTSFMKQRIKSSPRPPN